MKALVGLVVVVCSCLPMVAAAGVVEGNPDQRTSLFVGYGRAWGEIVISDPQLTQQLSIVEDSNRFFGELTIPADKWVSFVMAASVADSPGRDPLEEPNTAYTSLSLITMGIGVRFYLP